MTPDGGPNEAHGPALLLPLLNGNVTHVGISDDGALSLTVADRSVHCGSDTDFEAWHLAGPGGLLVVSTPGGGLAIWDAVEAPTINTCCRTQPRLRTAS